MPGVSLISTKSILKKEKINKVSDLCVHFPNYYKKYIYLSDNIYIGFTGYRAYPVEVVETKNYVVAIEGKIYNRPKEEILYDAYRIFEGDLRYAQKLVEYDGEFVVYIVSKDKSKICVYNDILSRLPCYYYAKDGVFLISRELKFIRNYIEDLVFDKEAICDQLLFSTFICDKTFFVDIKRLAPGNILTYFGGKLTLKSYYRFNFDDSEQTCKVSKKIAGKLGKLFIKLAEDRIRDYSGKNVVVSLSDGFDSRAALGALAVVGKDIKTITYKEFETEKQNEICDIAKKVADYHNVDWFLIKLQRNKFKDIIDVCSLFDATVPSITPYDEVMRYCRNEFGEDCIFFTGDDGNLIITSVPGYQEAKNAKSIDDLVKLIYKVRGNGFFRKDAYDLLELNKNEYINYFKSILWSYPEKSLVGKYIHFMFFATGVNMNFVREDRFRYFFWYSSLFWSPIFVQESMRLSQDIKEDRNIQIPFIRAVKACTTVPANGYKFGSSFHLKLKRALSKNRISANVYEGFKNLTTKKIATKKDMKAPLYDPNREIMGYQNILKEKSLFDYNKVMHIFNRGTSKTQFERIFTTSAYLG